MAFLLRIPKHLHTNTDVEGGEADRSRVGSQRFLTVTGECSSCGLPTCEGSANLFARRIGSGSTLRRLRRFGG